MNPQEYNFDFGIEDEYLVLTWTRLQHSIDPFAGTRYPQLKMRFKYGDISTDTVSAMLENLEVPHQFSRAILTLIAAQAA